MKCFKMLPKGDLSDSAKERLLNYMAKHKTNVDSLKNSVKLDKAEDGYIKITLNSHYGMVTWAKNMEDVPTAIIEAIDSFNLRK